MSDVTQASTAAPANFDSRRASRVSREDWAPNVAIDSLPSYVQKKIRKPHLLKAFAVVRCPQSAQYHCVAVIGRRFVLIDHPNPAGELALAAMVGTEIVRCRCHELRDYWATLRHPTGPGNRAYCTNLSEFPEALRELRERCRLPARDARKLSPQMKERFGKIRRAFNSSSFGVPEREHPLPAARVDRLHARLKAQTAAAGARFKSAFEAAVMRWLPHDFQLDFEYELSTSLPRLKRGYASPPSVEVDARLWWSRVGYRRREVVCARWFVLATIPTVWADDVLAWCVDLDAFGAYLTKKPSDQVDRAQALADCNVPAIITGWSCAQPQVFPLIVTASGYTNALSIPAAFWLPSFKNETT